MRTPDSFLMPTSGGRSLPGSLETGVERSIEAFDADSWARIARGGSFYGSHPYLRFSERCHQDETWYVSCRSEGRLVAALPAYDLPDGDGDAYDYRDQFGKLPCFGRLDPSCWYPGMLAGTRSGYVTDLLVDPLLGQAQRRDAVRRLVQDFRNLAAARARSAAALYLTPDAAVLLTEAMAGDGGSVQLLLSPFGTDTYLPLTFTSFEDYLRHLSAKRRYAVRREITAFRSTSRRIDVVRLAEYSEVLGPLLANVQRKYEHGSTDMQMTALLCQYAQALDDHSRVFLCRGARGEPLAYALFFVWDGVMYARNVGFHYDRMHGDDGTYFNLLLYEPIAYAIEHGYMAMHFGMASQAKAARGALVRPFWSLVFPPEGMSIPSAAQVAGWNKHWHKRWHEEYRPFARQFPEKEWQLAVSS